MLTEPDETAQEWTNRTVISHERTSVHYLVLPGSLFSITEITEYTHFSLMQSLAEIKYKSDSNPLALVIGPIPFL